MQYELSVERSCQHGHPITYCMSYTRHVNQEIIFLYIYLYVHSINSLEKILVPLQCTLGHSSEATSEEIHLLPSCKWDFMSFSILSWFNMQLLWCVLHQRHGLMKVHSLYIESSIINAVLHHFSHHEAEAWSCWRQRMLNEPLPWGMMSFSLAA